MKKTFLFLFLSSSVFAQEKVKTFVTDPQWDMRDHPLDMIHLRAELSFDSPKGLVKGKITHRFKPLRASVDSFYLDGPSIRISEAQIGGKAVRFKQDSLGFWFYPSPSLSWNKMDSITITYEANPRRGLYFIGWNDKNNLSRKQIWSQGQGIDNRNWLPMYDEMNDKITSELIISFDKEYKVLSNGKLVSAKEGKDGMKTWHYKMAKPHAPYLIMMAAGKYDIKESKSASGVPYNQYYYPEWKDRVPTAYKHSEEMMDFFEKEIGLKYPWESYSQIPVQDYMFGAMENTTATIFGDFSFVDERAFLDRSYVSTNAHELAHQWFGDYITARSARHHWLQESFATYYSALFEKEIYGVDHFDWWRKLSLFQAIDASKKDKMPIANSEAGTVRHYPKGAFVLNMLKNVVGGRETYNKAILHYLNKHPYGNVHSHDLLTAFEEVSGMPLEWFWEQWIYRGGEPSYKVDFRQVSGAGQETLEFDVSQVHERSDLVGLFKMPIWFEVVFADGSKVRKMEWIQKEHQTVRIPNPEKKPVAFALFDPNGEVMKTVQFNKTFEMFRNQALKAENMVDRYDAIVALKSVPFERKAELFEQVYAKEKFHAVKAELINQIVDVKDPKAIALLKNAVNAPEVQVRKAALTIKTIPSELLTEYEKLLKDPSYEAVTTALEKLCTDNPGKTMQYLDQTKGVEGTRGRIVLVKWLEIAALQTKEKQYRDQLINLTSGSYEFQTRVNAMYALRRLNHLDQTMIENLLDASFSANTRLGNPAIEVLKDLAGAGEYKKMIADFVAGKNYSGTFQKAAIKRILG